MSSQPSSIVVWESVLFSNKKSSHSGVHIVTIFPLTEKVPESFPWSRRGTVCITAGKTNAAVLEKVPSSARSNVPDLHISPGVPNITWIAQPVALKSVKNSFWGLTQP